MTTVTTQPSRSDTDTKLGLDVHKGQRPTDAGSEAGAEVKI